MKPSFGKVIDDIQEHTVAFQQLPINGDTLHWQGNRRHSGARGSRLKG
jgi:hypothetical protein